MEIEEKAQGFKLNREQYNLMNEIITEMLLEGYQILCSNCLSKKGYDDISPYYFGVSGQKCDLCEGFGNVGSPQVFDILRKYKIEKEEFQYNENEFNSTSVIHSIYYFRGRKSIVKVLKQKAHEDLKEEVELMIKKHFNLTKSLNNWEDIKETIKNLDGKANELRKKINAFFVRERSGKLNSLIEIEELVSRVKAKDDLILDYKDGFSL